MSAGVFCRRSSLVPRRQTTAFRSRSLREERERKARSCSSLLIVLTQSHRCVVQPWTSLLLNTRVSAPRNNSNV